MYRIITTLSSNKRLFAVLFVVGALSLTLRISGVRSTAQQSRSEAQTERVIESTIPKEVPITVKIRKDRERSFKDLTNERWARDFELEVTNTGDKAIYYLDILMVTDVKASDGHRIVFPLQYGRVGLGDIVSIAAPEDSSIRPGETYVLKVHAGQVPAWEKAHREENLQQPKRMRLELQLLSFGDGTGYFGNQLFPPQGKPRAPSHKQSINDQPQKGVYPNHRERYAITSGSDRPAISSPVNFFADSQSIKPSMTESFTSDGCLFSCTAADWLRLL